MPPDHVPSPAAHLAAILVTFMVFLTVAGGLAFWLGYFLRLGWRAAASWGF